MSFQFCLNTSTIRPQPLLKKIELVAQAGFEAIELWINDIYEFVGRGGEVADVEKALSDHGLFVPSVIAIRQWGDMEGREYELILEEAHRRSALGARLGAKYIVATPPLERVGQDHLPGRYRELLRIGREEGILPTFEYISVIKSVYKLSDAWRIVQEVDDPDATLILDAFHSWNSGSSLDDLRKIPAQRISQYHIDDAHPDKPALTQKDSDRVMLGEGQIDLAAEIAVLRQIGYQGTVSLELFNEELWAQHPAEVLKVGMERMRELFD